MGGERAGGRAGTDRGGMDRGGADATGWAADGPGAAEPTKAEIRRAVLARRRQRPAEERVDLAVRLRDVVLGTGLLPHEGGTVACYASRGGEPGTAALVRALAARGTTVLLPHTHDGSDGRGTRLGWGRAPGTAPGSAPGRPGAGDEAPLVPGPDLGPGALQAADVVLVPALAVDTAGRRLGKGGGYYDRALGELRDHRGWLPPVVALVHDDEVLDAAVEPVPAEAHDVRVSHVATPGRWMRVDG
ncbi:5-formyltetrahydrofolate cyclo-ligase [uncultured Pseudokineococcus sp.]|uniref:5-formyltetrahydrofolate cyclo-ligase n=1 Tax=uncultured Pseudokineococcus sp. TaxID=1642928 RepID=UPI00262A5B77|nr:5-formyltetrahydrofolate cyclo-ligase [uncultured Pseudokineococcus sp.]